MPPTFKEIMMELLQLKKKNLQPHDIHQSSISRNLLQWLEHNHLEPQTVSIQHTSKIQVKE